MKHRPIARLVVLLGALTTAGANVSDQGSLFALPLASADGPQAGPPFPDKWQYTVDAADPVGYFDVPEAVAVGVDGSVFISDGNNHRIQKFAADGSFLTTWGSLGNAEGQLGHPAGLAVAPDGTLVVADSLNHRLQRFKPSGHFVSRWGGSDAEPLGTPWGVAVAPDGSVFATDKARHRIIHFGADGQVIHAWGSEGGADGQLRGPQGIAVAPDGQTIAVADTVNNRIQRFTVAGEFIDLFYASGPGDRAYVKPQGVAFDAAGNLYILDTGNDRVQRLGADNTFNQWGATGDEDGQFDTPVGLATAPDGTVLVTDAGYDEVQRLTTKGEYVDSWGGYGGGDRSRPVAVLPGPDGVSVYVADQGLNAVYPFVSLVTPTTWSTGRYSGGYGTAPGRFRAVSDLIRVQEDVSHPELNLFTVDAANHRVDVFDSLGNYVRSFGKFGHGPGELYGPAALALAGQGAGQTIWVADSKNHRLQQFAPNGGFIKSVGSLGSGEGQFKRPRGMAVAHDGSLYVADSENGRIVHLTADGAWLGSFGRNGFSPGELYRPYDLALDAEGNIWVADSGNHRIQRFNTDGRWRAIYGGPGLDPTQFEWPTGIAISGDDLWVADSGNHRVQRLALDGSGVRGVLIQDDSTYAGNFNRPTGIAYATNLGTFYVSDSENGSIHTFDRQAGGLLRVWGQASLSPTDNGFRQAQGVMIKPDDQFHFGYAVVAADTHNHRLQVLPERLGARERMVGAKGSDKGQFVRPWDLVSVLDGSFLVSDNGNGRLVRFGADWSAQGLVGSPGKSEGQLNSPRGLAVDVDGSVVVADTGNYRVSRFSAEGQPLGGWPIPPNGPVDPDARTQPPGPNDVAVDADRLVYVVDPGFSRVARFDRAGQALGELGGRGAGVNQFQQPDSLVLSRSADPRLREVGGRWSLAVTDAVLNRVQVFDVAYPTKWRAAYYANQRFTGTPSSVTNPEVIGIDRAVDNQPMLKPLSDQAASLGEDGVSVRFERLVHLAGGQESYRLAVTHGGARLWFGDRLVVDEPDADGVTREGVVGMPAGDAVVRVEVVATGPRAAEATVRLDWTAPTQTSTIYLPRVRKGGAGR